MKTIGNKIYNSVLLSVPHIVVTAGRLGARFAYMLLSITLLISFTACNNASQERVEDQLDTMTSKVENKVAEVKQDMKDSKDENFVKEVIRSNDMELEMLDAALKNGTIRDVKDAAKKMKPDHEKMGKEMKAYAAGKNITLDVPDKDHNDMANEKLGKEWDKNWADKMVAEHERIVGNFEDGERDLSDPALKTIVTNALPTLRSHLEISKALRDKLNR